MDLKSAWKKTGKQLGHAFRDLGKTVVHTVAAGVQKAEQWAEEDGQHAQTDATPDTHTDED